MGTPANTASTELSLTVPITNSLAFMFTVLGEWWAEGKVISRGMSLRGKLLNDSYAWVAADVGVLDTWIGMAFVLGGIALCVQSKNAQGVVT